MTRTEAIELAKTWRTRNLAEIEAESSTITLMDEAGLQLLCDMLLAEVARSEKLEAVHATAESLSSAMYVGEGKGTSMRGLWCSGTADHAGLMLDMRAALAAAKEPL